jgi:hypothetical protein
LGLRNDAPKKPVSIGLQVVPLYRFRILNGKGIVEMLRNPRRGAIGRRFGFRDAGFRVLRCGVPGCGFSILGLGRREPV